MDVILNTHSHRKNYLRKYVNTNTLILKNNYKK